jgi:hypothetical protein
MEQREHNEQFSTCKLMTKKKSSPLKEAFCKSTKSLSRSGIWPGCWQNNQANSDKGNGDANQMCKLQHVRLCIPKVATLGSYANGCCNDDKKYLDKTVRVPSYMIHPVLALQPVHCHQLAQRFSCCHLLSPHHKSTLLIVELQNHNLQLLNNKWLQYWFLWIESPTYPRTSVEKVASFYQKVTAFWFRETMLSTI